nr:copia protein [Tanacetum cinerariifolium]
MNTPWSLFVVGVSEEEHRESWESGGVDWSGGKWWKMCWREKSTKQSAELPDTTSVSAGATLAAGDHISAVPSVSNVPSVSAASFIPAETPITTGVSTTAGVFESAYVSIIDLLDSPPKATSLPLDSETAKQVVPLRKSSRKKSMAKRRPLSRPSQSESATLSFDEDDLEAEFKKYLRQVSNDEEHAEPISLSLVFDIHTWEVIPTEFGLGEIHVITRADGSVKRFSTFRELMHWVGRADLMVLYGMVSDKYKLERATGIGLGLWSDLRTLITAREDRDASIIWDDQDQALIMSARVLNCPAFKLEEIVMAMMTCLKLSGVHYQCFTVECGLLWVLVVKPHNKTPYKNFLGRKPALSFMRPFGCPVTILNILDHLGTKANIDTVQAEKKIVSGPQYVFLPLLTFDSQSPKSSKDKVVDDAGRRCTKVPRKENGVQDPAKEGRERAQKNEFKSMIGKDKDANDNMIFTPVSVARSTYVYLGGSIPVDAATLLNVDLSIDPLMPDLKDTADTGIFSGAYDDEVEGKHAIGTKWVYRNKKDERRIVIRNKERLVAQGYTQEECINYDEVFPLVARIEAIMLFLAYASFMRFIVYQMDVKNAFLYDTIKEEVYVSQLPSFEDLHVPNKVYKVEKALYGLYQALRAWYETLSTYLLENGFRRGIIDKTLFIKKDKDDILLVQVYVDDIIFGSTKKSLCIEFEGLIHKKFQMSSMGELTFFLRLQVMQKNDGIFISQDKYVADILKKFDFSSVKIASTPIETNKALLKYLRDLPFDLEAFSDSDYARARLDRKSTTGGCKVLRKGLISWKCKKQTVVSNSTTEVEYVAVASCCGQIVDFLNANPIRYALTVNHTIYTLCIQQFWDSAKVKTMNEDVQIRALIDGKKIIVTEASIRRDLQLQDVEGKGFSGIITPLFETMMVQDPEEVGEGSKVPTDTHHTPFVSQPSSSQPQKKQKSRRKQRQETKVPHTEPQPEESVPITYNDPLPSESSKDKESMGDQEDESKQRRMIDNINQDEEIALVDKTHERMNEEEMFRVNDLDGDEVIVDVTAGENVEQSTKVAENEISTTDPVTTAGEIVTTVEDVEVTTAATTLQISKDELTLAQTLIKIKAAKPKIRGVIIQEPSKFRTTSSLQHYNFHMLKTKVTRKLKAEMKAEIEKEERIVREKDEANIAVSEQWNEVQAKIDVDMELAQKL